MPENSCGKSFHSKFSWTDQKNYLSKIKMEMAALLFHTKFGFVCWKKSNILRTKKIITKANNKILGLN